jgi:hypothetical protein
MDTNCNNNNNNNNNNNTNYKMDLYIALDLLDIDPKLPYSKLTREYVKRKYHKMALRFHPDKNGNTIEATQKFQRINEAYTYLLNEFVISSCLEEDINDINNTNNNKEQNTDKMYTTLLSLFLSSILQVNSKIMSDLLVKIIKDIVINGYKMISMTLIDELDKDMSLDLYNFLNKYKHILYIDPETLEFVSSLVKEKYKNDSVYILNPSIDDLLDSNIYKLYVDEQLYLVPLWHNEMYFEDKNKNDIIVLCNAELPENITIDEHNNIHCNLLVHFEKEMIINEQRFVNELDVVIGKHIFKIPFDHLYMRKEQKYIIKGKGISYIFENDIYNQSNKSRGDIIVNIVFV